MDISDKRENTKRVAKNTLLLFGRTLFMMFIGLLTSRVVFETLGVDDFGLYNVVGGFVSMFTLLTSSMISTSSRFITVELGKKDGDTKTVFSVVLTIQFILSLIIVLLGETFGLWFVNTQLNIDPERMFAANIVYQASLLSFVVNLLSVPYNSAIVAHERMDVYAYMSIFDASVKLLLVVLLKWVPFDKLIFYVIFWLIVDIITRFVYGIFCKRNFEECRFTFLFDKHRFAAMFSFTGWNVLGTSASVMSGHGVNILINIFCNTAVNAARGIGCRIDAMLMSFVGNFMTALRPQITKNFSSGNLDYSFSLAMRGAKFSFFLLLLFSMPVLLEMEFLIKLWLGQVPPYTVAFARLSVIYSLLFTFSDVLYSVVNASGRVKEFQIADGILIFLNFPLSYLFLKMNYPPYVTTCIALVISCVCLLVRVLILQKIVGFSFKDYMLRVVLRSIFVAVLSFVIPILLYNSIEASFGRFLLIGFVSVLSTFTVVYVCGLEVAERVFVLDAIRSVWNKLKIGCSKSL